MDILYFSPIMWDDLKQRPQHIAEELSKYHRIYFIEPSISYFKGLKEHSKLYKYNEYDINLNLKVIRPSGKYRLPKSLEVIDFFEINQLYEVIQLKKLIKKCEIVWLGSPIYYPLIRKFKSKKVIYDKMDDYEALTENKLLRSLINKHEEMLIKRASLIFTSAYKFYDDIKNSNPSIFLVKNGVGLDFTNEPKDCSEYSKEVIKDIKRLKKAGKVVFGYVGTIDHWFDYEALKIIVNHNKDFHVMLVGKNNVTKLKHENIHYYNPLPKAELAQVINEFNYCLYTFKKNKLLDTIDPVKIYEYLSINQKVFAIKSKETQKLEKYLILYDDYDELRNLLNNINSITGPFSSDLQRSDFIKENSWTRRVKAMNDIISCNI